MCVQALALLRSTAQQLKYMSVLEKVLMAASLLLAFDSYARGNDFPQLLRAELRAPRVVLGHGTLTFFPSTRLIEYQTPLHPLLMGTASRFSREAFNNSRTLAGWPKSSPHRLRHGGASADAEHGFSELVLMQRRSWESAKTLLIYRQTVRYLTPQAPLTPAQLQDAKTAHLFVPALMRKLLR